MSGERLVSAFSPFFKSYERLLRFGAFSPRNRGIRRFLSLFVFAEADQRRIRFAPRGYRSRRKLAQVAGWLVDRYERLDIESELRLVFLEAAHRWRPRGKVGFAGYLVHTYPFMLARRLKRLGRDPADWAARIPEVSGRVLPWNPEEPWVNDTSEWLEDLNGLERYLGWCRWVKGLSIGEIARLTGYDRKTIGLKMKSAEKKLWNRLSS